MPFLRLLAEALLYYVACSLVARTRADAPGFLRVLFTVLILTFISGGLHAVIGGFWLSNALIFVLTFIVLWIGLGIGFFRTIIAALLVLLLRALLTAVFTRGDLMV